MQIDEENKLPRQVFSLSDITESIARMFNKYYAVPYWIRAEISKLNYYPASGHCFPDLVEKQDGKIKSQVRSIIWRDDLFQISTKFEEVTRQPLSEGMAIMFQAYVKFTSAHGLSLHIIDIEPLYTLGELAREKMAAIERMKKEGIFQQNKLVPLPLLLKRVAIISAETSKGYRDLLVTLDNNPAGYRFISKLFPALLQGDGAVEAIRKQLQKIKENAAGFDAVLIIRGGGDEVGLACYDHYDLAREVALFPLPVITGIGHSTNETVVEMVACINKITPTDVAHFMIAGFRSFDDRINLAVQNIKLATSQLLESANLEFNQLTEAFQQTGRLFIDTQHETIGQLALAMRESVSAAVFNHRIALSR
ncbi:MAG: exodeoxyribonuclease VII large subunit, partial [Bacteroidetes bacterium HGW-Bacteroidetes-9]